MTTLVSDDFNRADTTTIGTPSVGPTAVTRQGTPRIETNRLRGNPGPAIVTWDASTTTVTLESNAVAVSSNSILSLLLGWVSNTDYHYVTFNQYDVSLFRKVGTDALQIARSNPRSAFFPSGSTAAVKVAHRDGHLWVYLAGVLIIECQMPFPVSSNHHGFLFTETNWTRADDLLVTDSPPVFANTDMFLYRGRDTKTLDTAGVV